MKQPQATLINTTLLLVLVAATWLLLSRLDRYGIPQSESLPKKREPPRSGPVHVGWLAGESFPAVPPCKRIHVPIKGLPGATAQSFPINLGISICDESSEHTMLMIVSYRNRTDHLGTFTAYMTAWLNAQRQNWAMLIVEQSGREPFNRGMLHNVGVSVGCKVMRTKEGWSFVEHRGWGALDGYVLAFDYFVFHDVDHLPLDPAVEYSHKETPFHWASASSKFSYKLPNSSYVGGALQIPGEVYIAINGHSNQYWGTGYDDDIVLRLELANAPIQRLKPLSRGKFLCLEHESTQASDWPETKRRHLQSTKQRFRAEGFNSVLYKVRMAKSRYVERGRFEEDAQMYTHLVVDLPKLTDTAAHT